MTDEIKVEWTQVGGVASCFHCGQPDYMFVNNYMTESQKERQQCVDCALQYSRQNIAHLHPGMPYGTAHRLLIEAIQSAYDYRTVGMTEWCEVCYRPFLESEERYQQVTAYDATGKMLVVHRKCSTVSTCSRVECRGKLVIDSYSTWDRNNWSQVPSSSWTYYTFHHVDGERLCSVHLEEWREASDDNGYSWFCCDGCSNYFRHDHSDYFTNNDYIYCEDCRNEHFYYCDNCDETVHHDDFHDCERVSSVVHSYGYKPFPCLFGKSKESTPFYHLGFELEVEQRNEDNCYDEAVKIQEVLGARAYMKEDGSLRGGFEIVTHPHTLEEYKDNFPWEFIQVAKRNNLVSWNSPRCGFHVHVSRYAFGPGMKPGDTTEVYYQRTIIVRQQHELKFLKLIYDNERQVQRLAGRKSDWARFTDKGNLWRKVKQGYQSEGHYSAVNVENNNTIEVRVFRGSLKRERLMANLEFVHSAVEYTRNLRVSATNKALSWIAYSGYVYQNADKYPHLLEYMDTITKQEQVYDNRTEEEDN